LILPKSGAGEAETPLRPVRVWDLPTRLVHWLIAALIPFSWWSATNDHLSWHRLSGYVMLGLLGFRLIWGVIGSSTARFSDFVAGPPTVIAYLRGRSGARRIGHNPLGGWSVIALLTVLALQIGLGLFAVDEDAIEAGPLSKFVSFDTGRAITHWHHQIFWVLVALITVHLVAILVYALRRKNLIGPMITGVARLSPSLTAPAFASRTRLIIAAAVAAGLTWFVAHGLSFKP
jgi:cytochrome b